MTRIEKHKEQRRVLAGIIGKLDSLEGKYTKKLGEANIATIRASISEASAADCGAQRWEIDGKLSLESVRKHLRSLEDNIHRADTLETLPEIEEYRAIIEKARAIESKLQDKLAVVDAARLGLIPGRVQWGA